MQCRWKMSGQNDGGNDHSPGNAEDPVDDSPPGPAPYRHMMLYLLSGTEAKYESTWVLTKLLTMDACEHCRRCDDLNTDARFVRMASVLLRSRSNAVVSNLVLSSAAFRITRFSFGLMFFGPQSPGSCGGFFLSRRVRVNHQRRNVFV